METQTRGISYPDGLDEAKFNELLQVALDGVDRDRLFEDSRLRRVRHPLLQERLGKDVALNTEIHNLITDMVTGLMVLEGVHNRDELRANAATAQQILAGAAKDPNSFQTAVLAVFKEAVSKLMAANAGTDEFEVGRFVDQQLRKKLPLPNLAQEMVLYPPVTNDALGEPPVEVLEVLRSCKLSVLEALTGQEDQASRALRKAVEEEASAVQAWYARATAV